MWNGSEYVVVATGTSPMWRRRRRDPRREQRSLETATDLVGPGVELARRLRLDAERIVERHQVEQAALGELHLLDPVRASNSSVGRDAGSRHAASWWPAPSRATARCSGSGTARSPWRRSATACSSPSGSRNSALPATSTLAPAAAARATVSRPDAAVDLEVDGVGAPGRLDHPADLGDLRLHRRDVRLAAETGVDGHHEHEIDEVEHVGDGARRRRRVEGDGGLRAELTRPRRAPGGGGCTPRRGRSGDGNRPRRSAGPSPRV